MTFSPEVGEVSLGNNSNILFVSGLPMLHPWSRGREERDPGTGMAPDGVGS